MAIDGRSSGKHRDIMDVQPEKIECHEMSWNIVYEYSNQSLILLTMQMRNSCVSSVGFNAMHQEGAHLSIHKVRILVLTLPATQFLESVN